MFVCIKINTLAFFWTIYSSFAFAANKFWRCKTNSTRHFLCSEKKKCGFYNFVLL